MSEENNENLGDEIKDEAKNIADEAKSTTEEFKEGWNEATKGGENKKLLAGLLAIFVGYFGVHKFILGYNKEGFILLGGFLIGVVTYCFVIGIFIIMAVGIVSLIEGIIYLTKSDEEFYETYQVNKKPWF
ncbi:MAG: TM2 domain-containing protein [Flavobacteriaceae bacterium]|nr:TM2 domain-containing protein [Flavobacteriaceae bacterium]